MLGIEQVAVVDASPAVCSISMKVTVKTVKGAATSYEVETDLKVISTGRLGCALVPGAALVNVILEPGSSRPARLSRSQVADFKKQIEEKQGAEYPADRQKVIFKGVVRHLCASRHAACCRFSHAIADYDAGHVVTPKQL